MPFGVRESAVASTNKRAREGGRTKGAGKNIDLEKARPPRSDLEASRGLSLDAYGGLQTRPSNSDFFFSRERHARRCSCFASQTGVFGVRYASRILFQSALGLRLLLSVISLVNGRQDPSSVFRQVFFDASVSGHSRIRRTLSF